MSDIRKLQKRFQSIEVKIGVLEDKEKNLTEELLELGIDVSQMSNDDLLSLKDELEKKQKTLSAKIEKLIESAENDLEEIEGVLNDD